MPRQVDEVDPLDEFEPLMSYASFSNKMDAWYAGNLSAVLFYAESGLGKSEAAKHIGQRNVDWFSVKGNASAFGTFSKLRQHPTSPFLFDDTYSLLQKTEGRELMSCVADTETPRIVTWTKRVGKEGIPEPFAFYGSVAFFLNQLPQGNIIPALFDRVHKYWFRPPFEEVRTYASTWYWCQRAFDLWSSIGAAGLLRNFSCRPLVLAWDRMRVDGEWAKPILTHVRSTIAGVRRKDWDGLVIGAYVRHLSEGGGVQHGFKREVYAIYAALGGVKSYSQVARDLDVIKERHAPCLLAPVTLASAPPVKSEPPEPVDEEAEIEEECEDECEVLA